MTTIVLGTSPTIPFVILFGGILTFTVRLAYLNSNGLGHSVRLRRIKMLHECPTDSMNLPV